MTGDERAALDALRRRLSHTEAICAMLIDRDDSETAEAMRGVRLLIEDGSIELGRILDTAIGVNGGVA